MNGMVGLIVAFIVVVPTLALLVFGWAVSRSRRSQPPGLYGGQMGGPLDAPVGDPVAGPAMAPQGYVMGGPGSLPPDLLAHVRTELAEGRKIQAIKLVRQHTGLGLKEAKQMVDALDAGGPMPVAGPVGPGPVTYGPPESAGAGEGGMLSDRVRAFEQAGDHASAVALVRSQTGMTADEAERFIAALD